MSEETKIPSESPGSLHPVDGLRGWVMQERGWWTHEMLGGICRERGGWWVYLTEKEPRGPYKTLREVAQSIAERSNPAPKT